MTNDIQVNLGLDLRPNPIFGRNMFWTYEAKGTPDIDVVSVSTLRRPNPRSALNQAFPAHLSEIKLKRIDSDTFSIELAGQPETAFILDNFNPGKDIIRVTEGDFTLQEILDHGNNAPYYKQARVNAGIQNKQ